MPDAGLGDRLHGDRCEMGATGKQHLQALEPIRTQRRGMHSAEITYQQQARRWSGQSTAFALEVVQHRRAAHGRAEQTGQVCPSTWMGSGRSRDNGGRHRVWLESRRWRSPSWSFWKAVCRAICVAHVTMSMKLSRDSVDELGKRDADKATTFDGVRRHTEAQF
jgi:hypothetical protein